MKMSLFCVFHLLTKSAITIELSKMESLLISSRSKSFSETAFFSSLFILNNANIAIERPIKPYINTLKLIYSTVTINKSLFLLDYEIELPFGKIAFGLSG